MNFTQTQNDFDFCKKKKWKNYWPEMKWNSTNWNNSISHTQKHSKCTSLLHSFVRPQNIYILIFTSNSWFVVEICLLQLSHNCCFIFDHNFPIKEESAVFFSTVAPNPITRCNFQQSTS